MLRLVSAFRLWRRVTHADFAHPCSPSLCYSEYHYNNDIALAVYQQYASSQNRTFLETKGWPIVRSVAEFWAAHVVYNETTLRYDTFNET